MKKISLFTLSFLSLFADIDDLSQDRKNQTIELSYTFSKVSRYPTNTFNLFTPETSKTDTQYDTFNWGKQASFSYEKILSQSSFSFLTNLTFLHAGHTFSLRSDDQSSPYILGESKGADGKPGFTYHRMQMNFYEADFFVKNTLSKSKYAIFDVFGGVISSWYKYKFVKNYLNNPSTVSSSSLNSVFTNTNFFMGPNLKIQIKAPFYKNYFVASLKAGLGMMVNFKSYQTHSHSTVIVLNTVSSSDSSNNLKNDYQFCPQADLEAYLGFKYKGFNLDAGVNQFFLIQNLLENRSGSLTFGGPFLRAGYSF